MPKLINSHINLKRKQPSVIEKNLQCVNIMTRAESE